jgi:hypothetical protein
MALESGSNGLRPIYIHEQSPAMTTPASEIALELRVDLGRRHAKPIDFHSFPEDCVDPRNVAASEVFAICRMEPSARKTPL